MKQETATFGAGCFWGVEEAFRTTPGVKETAAGYAGGKTENPTYEHVCGHTTGHAEVVQVVFDPDDVSYEKLLEVFWDNHNPTTKNRQGELRRVPHQADVAPDVGDQYRSVIFYHSLEQKAAAEKVKEALEKSGKWKSPVVTEISPASKFYRAEDYHQKYLMKRGMDSCHI